MWSTLWFMISKLSIMLHSFVVFMLYYFWDRYYPFRWTRQYLIRLGYIVFNLIACFPVWLLQYNKNYDFIFFLEYRQGFSITLYLTTWIALNMRQGLRSAIFLSTKGCCIYFEALLSAKKRIRRIKQACWFQIIYTAYMSYTYTKCISYPLLDNPKNILFGYLEH